MRPARTGLETGSGLPSLPEKPEQNHKRNNNTHSAR